MEAKENKYLSFVLEAEEYALPIRQVKEIIGMLDITSIPKTAEYLRGVINLRGKIIPVIDVRIKFSMELREYNHRTCIIVVEMHKEEHIKQIGIIVDTVSEVINISDSEIEPPPLQSSNLDNSMLTGIGKKKDKILLLIDIEKILTVEEAELLREIR